jgi:REP element-mobilizing transposase RayT
MAHTYVCNYLHCVFGTKDRADLIRDPQRLWAYVGGLTRANKIPLLAAGGTKNHLHTLISLPSTITIAQAMQIVKGSSSHCMNETFGAFAWQEGYGAFSVSQSQRTRVVQYIDGQEEHHKKWSFEEEFASLLRKYDVSYDPRYMPG